MVVISDWDKGLQEAVTTHLPLAKHVHCCQHIADNVQHTFSKACRDRFWAIAYAKTRAEFHLAIVCTHARDRRRCWRVLDQYPAGKIGSFSIFATPLRPYDFEYC